MFQVGYRRSTTFTLMIDTQLLGQGSEYRDVAIRDSLREKEVDRRNKEREGTVSSNQLLTLT